MANLALPRRRAMEQLRMRSARGFGNFSPSGEDNQPSLSRPPAHPRTSGEHAAVTTSDTKKKGGGVSICMPTRRDFRKQVFLCSLYEAEDVLAQTDDVDLIRLQPDRGFELRNRWLSRLVFRDPSERLVLGNPGVRRVQLTKDYNLFIAVCHSYEDLLYVNAVEGWKNHCNISICWIHEVWAGTIQKYRHWMSALRRFDYVFVGVKETVAPLSKEIGSRCYYLASAVDTCRFSPRLHPVPRTIDVLSIGRRWTEIHQVFRSQTLKDKIFYMHDTFAAATADVFDYREHREQFARLVQRSRYFLVAPAKMDAAAETKGQIEVGFRYFEGAAAGAVMIGQTPHGEAFREMFGWPNSVIEIRPDGSDVLDVIRGLDAQPQLLREISERNARQALLRHDWIHRWRQIFEIAGIEPSAGMVGRINQLRQLAEQNGYHAA